MMNFNKFILISPIEIAGRELLSKCALCCEFVNKSNNIAIISDKSSAYKLLGKSNNQIYIDRGYHEGSSENIYRLFKNNVQLISIDEENGVDYDDFSSITSRFPKKIFELASYICIWGFKAKEHLRKIHPFVNFKNLGVTGHIRFHLLKDQYMKIYEKDVLEIKNKYQDFILINTDFGFANNIMGIEVILKKYSSRVKRLKGAIEYQQIQCNNFISLVKDLAKVTKKNIVIRPHPEESHEIYIKSFNLIDNVHVVYEGSVIPWIIASEKMIHHDCTTAIECLMLGKKPIAYIKDLNKFYTTKASLMVSEKFDNSMELIKFIQNENVETNEYSKILDEYFGFYNNSIKLIKDRLVKLTYNVKNKNKLFNIQFLFSLMYLKLHFILRMIFKRKAQPLFINKMNGFTEENIKNYINNYCESSSIKKPNVYKITDRLFIICN